jgi:glycosyltransferase involved in cell wall biosynthesis
MDSITACISTKDRYGTTLPLAIAAICAQTVRPKQLVIFDDGECKDLRNVSPYNHLFQMLLAKGINWFVIPGQHKGQVANHQTALDRADTEFVWRCDDDNAPEPDCLEKLLLAMKDPAVGAAGGLVLFTSSANGMKPSFLSGRIEEVFCPMNHQWYRWPSTTPEEVDHLYSTFVYRVDAARKSGGYPRNLSPIGHHEETIFSHGIRRAGYRLLVVPDAVTWHLREETGGIRSYKDPNLWAHDSQCFVEKLREWRVTPYLYKFIVLDNGLGDHIMFKAVLPEILAKHAGKRIVLFVCYPEVFEGVAGITLATISDAHAAFGNLDGFSVYKWCEERHWQRSLADAFLEMLL